MQYLQEETSGNFYHSTPEIEKKNTLVTRVHHQKGRMYAVKTRCESAHTLRVYARDEQQGRPHTNPDGIEQEESNSNTQIKKCGDIRRSACNILYSACTAVSPILCSW